MQVVTDDLCALQGAGLAKVIKRVNITIFLTEYLDTETVLQVLLVFSQNINPMTFLIINHQ